MILALKVLLMKFTQWIIWYTDAYKIGVFLHLLSFSLIFLSWRFLEAVTWSGAPSWLGLSALYYYLGHSGFWIASPKRDTWLFTYRWKVVFPLWVIPAIIVSGILVAWGYDQYVKVYNIDKPNLPTFLPTLALWPLFLLLWYIRDYNKNRDLLNTQIGIHQEDFHKIQERIADYKNKERQAICIASIHQIKRFITGEIMGNFAKSPFRSPAQALLQAIVDDILDKVKGEFKGTQEVGGADGDLESNEIFRAYQSEPLIINIQTIISEVTEHVRLIGMRFPYANFGNTKMDSRNLSEWVLKCASLSKANLVRANLSDANLSRADLSSAELSEANLSGANLSGANLSKAELWGANMPEANLEDIQNWGGIQTFRHCNIYEVANPPKGFYDWALSKGAVEMNQDEWTNYQFKV